MKQASFREILEQFLEEESINSPLENAAKTAFSHEIPFTNLDFTSEFGPRSTVRAAYPHSAKAAKVAAPVPPPPRVEVVEPLIPLEKLSSEHKILSDALIRCGAIELANGLSASRLKKAHRRLVKSLHPDRSPHARVETFMLVQEAYEALSEALPGYYETPQAAA